MEARPGLSHLFLFWITLVLEFSPSFSNPLMYYIDKTNVRSYDLSTGNTSMILPSAFTNGIAMDFHHGNQKLYVGDVVTKEVYSVDLSASSLEPAPD